VVSGQTDVQENKCLTRNHTGVVAPVVDSNRCEGTNACFVVYPYGVFQVRKEVDSRPENDTASSVRFSLRPLHSGRPLPAMCRHEWPGSFAPIGVVWLMVGLTRKLPFVQRGYQSRAGWM
jgi:NAD-dependent dihydropyrimidine dehydrogenase PreA subunit